MAILSFVTLPLLNSVYVEDGITINTLIEGYPMEEINPETPFIIKEINGMPTLNFGQFLNATKEIKPNQEILLETDKGKIKLTTVENPDNKSKGFMGVKDFGTERKPNENIVSKFGAFVPPLVNWFHMLVFWLWVISLGIGLFNLLPLGPIDGGRMLLTGLFAITKNEKTSQKYWSYISFFSLLLIFINLAPFLWKLLLFLIKPVILLIALI